MSSRFSSSNSSSFASSSKSSFFSKAPSSAPSPFLISATGCSSTAKSASPSPAASGYFNPTIFESLSKIN